jgi:protein TonB
MGTDDPGPAGSLPMEMGSGRGEDLGLGDVGAGTGPAVVRAAPSGPVRVSSGVSSGMLLTVIQPAYPAIAKAAGIQGTVVVEAVISKTGRINSARAVSGPDMLKKAAVDAVSAARYRPFELNGQPVEVQTSVTVNFRMGG